MDKDRPQNDAMPTEKANITAYVDEDLKRKVELLAAAESRSISNLVEVLLKNAVAKAERDGVISIPTSTNGK